MTWWWMRYVWWCIQCPSSRDVMMIWVGGTSTTTTVRTVYNYSLYQTTGPQNNLNGSFIKCYHHLMPQIITQRWSNLTFNNILKINCQPPALALSAAFLNKNNCVVVHQLVLPVDNCLLPLLLAAVYKSVNNFADKQRTLQKLIYLKLDGI